MGCELRVRIAEEGAGAERLDELAGFLRQELLQLDVEDVTPLRTGEPPPGARVFDVLAVGELLVKLGGTANGLRSVISAIRTWLSRRPGVRRSVRLEIDGDVLELAEVTSAEQQRLIRLFVSRHSAGDGEA